MTDFESRSESILEDDDIAVRLVQPADWYASTGAGFPVDDQVIKELPRQLRKLYKDKGGWVGAVPPAARRRLECELFKAAHWAGLTARMDTE